MIACVWCLRRWTIGKIACCFPQRKKKKKRSEKQEQTRRERREQTIEGEDLIAEDVHFGSEGEDLSVGRLFLAFDVCFEMVDLTMEGGDGGHQDLELPVQVSDD